MCLYCFAHGVLGIGMDARPVKSANSVGSYGELGADTPVEGVAS
jgi:hypothetical protein